MDKIKKKIIKSSLGFTLVELLVVVAIIGILSAVGIVSYNGYTKGAKQKTVISAMQQIKLAQTEEYSNTNSYITSGCGDAINNALFSGSDVVPKTNDVGYEICLASDADVDYKVVATSGPCVITIPRIGDEVREPEGC